MSFFLLALSLLVLTALLSLLGRRANDLTIRAAPLGTMLASIAGLYPAVQVLASGQALTFYAPWSLPGAAFHLVIDPLAAFFLLPVFILSALAAIYGQAYLRVAAPQRSLGVATASFNLLLLAMVLVITAHNIMLFLLAWELMALVSFLLVMFEGAAPDVQKAGWTYLVAMHIGTVFVIVFFLLLGHHAASFDFNHFGPLKQLPLNLAGLAFILAWVGFGTKAGFVPMHVWLPEAHPAAPSHVSAVMSGVMIKTGIYGLLRALTFLPAPPAWWGWSLIISGLLSGLFGVLYALTQPDIKRLMAYQSVENIGIITLAFGCALLVFTYGSLPVAVLGLTGALLQ
ncbi:MAG: hypothetical protein GX806_05480 [Lentisphaerae bacterium]|nr:hypothetical protein [Lentisphaerota bacterium]